MARGSQRQHHSHISPAIFLAAKSGAAKGCSSGAHPIGVCEVRKLRSGTFDGWGTHLVGCCGSQITDFWPPAARSAAPLSCWRPTTRAYRGGRPHARTRRRAAERAPHSPAGGIDVSAHTVQASAEATDASQQPSTAAPPSKYAIPPGRLVAVSSASRAYDTHY